MDERLPREIEIPFFKPRALAGFTLGLLPEKPSMVFLRQVHGANGVRVTRAHVGVERMEADWMWTTDSSIHLGVRVADCTAILIWGTGDGGEFVAAIHAGWRGTAAGILESALDSLRPQGKLKIWLSPSISQEKFEVGEEVIESFHPQARTYTRPSLNSGKWLFDLKGFQLNQLQKFPEAKVLASPLCTYLQPEFYSYRRLGPSRDERHIAWITLRT